MDDTSIPSRAFDRTFALEDIAIRSGGDGRTVTAYAAAFDVNAEITDQDGHYIENLSRTSFDKTLQERAGRIGVFYNHGKTLYGTPSDRFSVPIGVPEEIRPDARGLFTVTRYNRSDPAEQVLESIRNGEIKGQSFSGKFVDSKRTRGNGGGLDTITRNQIALREYGPTPFPAYHEAAVLGVRMEELVDTLKALTDDQRSELLQLISDTSQVGEGPSTSTEAATGTTEGIRQAAQHLTGHSPIYRERLLALAGVNQP